MTGARRTALFVGLCVTAVALAGGYLLRALQRPAIAQAPGLAAASIAVSLPPAQRHPSSCSAGPGRGPRYGVLAYTDRTGRRRRCRFRTCDASACTWRRGRGVCLAARGGTAFRARLFDDRFKVFAELPLPGVPSRTQVAPDGKLAATTVFVSGHSYTDAGLLDADRGSWI